MTINSAIAFLALVTLTPAAQRPGGTVPLEAADCSRVQSSFGTDEVATAVQHASIPMSAGTLDVDPGQNGGVRIERGSGAGDPITACIAAGSEVRADGAAPRGCGADRDQRQSRESVGALERPPLERSPDRRGALRRADRCENGQRANLHPRRGWEHHGARHQRADRPGECHGSGQGSGGQRADLGVWKWREH